MKKFLTLLMMAFVCIAVNAQSPCKSYCQVRAEWRGNYYIAFDSDVTDKIKSGSGISVKLTNEDGQEVKSKNCVDIINYLAKQGWVVVGTSTWSSGGEMNLVYFYTLEKTASTEDELIKGIRLLAK